jgi:hypothetical protein
MNFCARYCGRNAQQTLHVGELDVEDLRGIAIVDQFVSFSEAE